jgi:adenylosuccinate synthase
LTELVVTKLDVLSAFASLKVCVAYEFEGRRYDVLPPNQTIFNKCRPIYRELAGWQEDISHAQEKSDLPGKAAAYLETIEELVRAPVSAVSVGAAREQLVDMSA